MSRSMRVVTAALLIGLSGCALFFESPGVRIVDVGIRSLGFTGGTATVTVGLSNPNKASLEVEGFVYKLEVERVDGEGGWVIVAEGITDQEVRVPARDSVTVELPVPFEYGGIGAALRSIFERGEVEYRASGEVWVRGPVGRIRVPYRHQGVLGT